MTVRITAENLGVSYGSVPVWRGINLDMGDPGLISILGPNGAGKSTFMYTINKILEPTEGRILVNGTDVMDLTFKDLAKLIAYVPQASGETFAMTVMDTVLMGRYPHSGYTVTEEDLEIAADCLEKMHMAEFAMRNFNELSAGQRQRVMLARGLVQKPQAILLDEPTSNLDIKHQLGISRLLRNLSSEEGLLVIVISHDLNIAAKYSDNIILLSEGTIYAVGTPEEVLTVENIRDVYGVECRVIPDKGVPHIILDDDSEVSRLPPDTVCRGSGPECRNPETAG